MNIACWRYNCIMVDDIATKPFMASHSDIIIGNWAMSRPFTLNCLMRKQIKPRTFADAILFYLITKAPLNRS